jgi:hypothetical protein
MARSAAAHAWSARSTRATARATPIDAARIVVEEIEVIGSRCGRFAPAIERIGAIDVGSLVSETVSLDRGEQALVLAAKPGVLKILLAR